MRHWTKSKFITLEGIEGGGKSTQIKLLTEYLREQGVEVVQTREPGGTEIADNIRELLLREYQEDMHMDTELLLMFASRAQHIATVIRPALNAGKWVISDRFTAASYAYQGGGRGVPFRRIAALEEWVQQGLQPDLTFILDVPIETGLARIATRGARDRIEMEEDNFFIKVRNAYLQLAEQEPGRYCILNASEGIEAVQAKMQRSLKGKLDDGYST